VSSTGRLDGVVLALGRTLTHAEMPKSTEALDAFFDTLGLDPRDKAALVALGPKRLSVYRSLVRGTLSSSIEKQLALTVAALGARFESELSQFFAEGMPASHYLFDVGFAFVTSRSPAWAADPSLPPYLSDLAHFELLDFAVAALRTEPPGSDVVPELGVDAPLVFDEAKRLARYDYAVHAIAEGETPEPGETWVLTYRDADDDIQHLPLDGADALLLEALFAGKTVREAIAKTSSTVAVAPSIEAIAAFLADLAERGVLLGRRHVAPR